MSKSPSRRRRWLAAALALPVFVVFLVMPALTGAPLSYWLNEFSRSYERQFPCRPLLTGMYHSILVRGLGVRSLPTVIVGREGWLFLAQEQPGLNEQHYFLGLTPFSPDELERWERVLEKRRRWLGQRGIVYIVVIAPNKSSVYADKLPDEYQGDRRTRLDQITSYLGSRGSGVALIDPRQVLIEGRRQYETYWATDTHWNTWGAFLACGEIIRNVGLPGMEMMPLDRFSIRRVEDIRGDLQEALSIELNRSPAGIFPELIPRPPPAIKLKGRTEMPGGEYWTYTSSPGGSLSAFVIHDSFGEYLKALLPYHFRECTFVLDRGHSFPRELIEKKHPAVVIEEMTERYLDLPPWSNPKGLSK